MTAQETATLAQQGEKLDALSWAIKEIKDMLTKRDDMCAIHTETIARIATRTDALEQNIIQIKSTDLHGLKQDIIKKEEAIAALKEAFSKSKIQSQEKIIYTIVGFLISILIAIVLRVV